MIFIIFRIMIDQIIKINHESNKYDNFLLSTNKNNKSSRLDFVKKKDTRMSD